MKSRSPRIIVHPVTRKALFEPATSGGVRLALPVHAARSGQAFRSSGNGGVEVAVGSEITNDDHWEESPDGGIRLKLT